MCTKIAWAIGNVVKICYPSVDGTIFYEFLYIVFLHTFIRNNLANKNTIGNPNSLSYKV